ncbi:MAG TPA: patatin-like phospholipase family protein [bacterium]|nr:patatin-like phospholipase family protein [bacterium]
MKFGRKNILLIIILLLIVMVNGQNLNNPRPRVGIALSGGGALGLAHLGMLKKIDSLNIPVDYIAGTSMGGLVGGLYACGYSALEIEKIVKDLKWEELFRDTPSREHLPYFVKKDLHKFQFKVNMNKYRPELPGLINGQKIELYISRLVYDHLDTRNFDNLPIPFRCVSVDIVSGSEVVHRKGNLARAMRATMSVPSIFAPVKMGDSLLIDGGLLNNIPVDVVKNMGADIVIASSVKTPSKTVDKLNNPLEVISQSYNIIRNKAIQEKGNKADLHLSTLIEDQRAFSFDSKKTDAIIKRGEQIANRYIDELIQIKKKNNLEKLTIDDLLSKNYILANIKFTGNLSIPDSSIINKLSIRTGNILRKQDVNSALESLRNTGWFSKIDYKLTEIGNNSIGLQFKVKESEKPYIFSIRINGNKKLPFGFIYRMLGIKPGEKLQLGILENRISLLYGLEYFKKINYDIEKVDFRKIKLDINVQESSFRKLRLGLRYDNNYGFVANLSSLQNNFIFPGLKATDELHFLGIFRLKNKIYYPSRTFSQPFYPFFHFDYKIIPRSIYHQNGFKIAEYDHKTINIGGGAGFVFNNSLNAEISANREYINIEPEIQLPDTSFYPSWKTTLDKINLTLNYDDLDNSINPESGLAIEGGLEYCDYFDLIESEEQYYKFHIKADLFYTPVEFLTISNSFYMFQSSSGTPNYKGEFIGGPDNFIGVKYNQFIVKNFRSLSTSLEFHLPEEFSIKFLGNYALECEHSDIYVLDNYESLAPRLGVGIGVKKELPIGPFEIIFARGPKGFTSERRVQSVLYIKAGYKF